jgi:ferrous iron transport protein A
MSNRGTLLTLSELSPGQSAVVDEVVGDDSLASRLMEMGILDGEAIEVIGRAPMGDPTRVSHQSATKRIRPRSS